MPQIASELPPFAGIFQTSGEFPPFTGGLPNIRRAFPSLLGILHTSGEPFPQFTGVPQTSGEAFSPTHWRPLPLALIKHLHMKLTLQRESLYFCVLHLNLLHSILQIHIVKKTNKQAQSLSISPFPRPLFPHMALCTRRSCCSVRGSCGVHD